jgi:hypothetical protein
VKHRRFRFGRRDARSLSPESLESVLSADIPSASNETNFEDMVLGQVDAARPFLGAAERKQVRWIRMSLIGLALGVFASGAIAVRAGLLPGTDGPGVVSSMVVSAQNKSMDQIESASTWRSEALIQLTAFKDRQRIAELSRRTTPAQSSVLVSSNRPSRAPYSPNASVAIGLTMQSPSCSVTEADNTSCQQVIVFNDGLAIPAGRSFMFSGTASGLVTRWPSTVQQSIEQIGLEGSGEYAIGGFIPPWYGSDVIRLPEIITVRPHPDPSNPH